MLRWFFVLFVFVFLLSGCLRELVAGEIGVRGKDVEFIQKEITVLIKEKPLPYSVEVIRIGSDMSGWCVSKLDTNYRLIYIAPNKKDLQLRVLRHEWHNLWRESKGLSCSTEEARAEATKAEEPKR